MNIAVPLRERVLAAAAATPSLTRRQGRWIAAILAALSVAIAVALFFLAGAPAVARPLAARARIADGWALVSAALAWLLFVRARHAPESSMPLLRAATRASPLLLLWWLSRSGGDDAGWGDAAVSFGLTLAAAATPLAAFLFLQRGSTPRHPETLGAAAGATCGAGAQVIVLLRSPATVPAHALVGHAIPLMVLAALGGWIGRRCLAAPSVRFLETEVALRRAHSRAAVPARRRAIMLRSTLLFFSIIAASGAAACTASVGSPPAPDCTAPDGHPTALACTGLYTDMSTGEISEDVSAYEPGAALWADGATKRRFIQLPAGTTIDTHDMDHWVFPNGTKLWKEFSLGGKKVETRFIEKKSDGTWFRTVYAWNADETEASEVTTGIANVNGTGYDIPSQGECTACHAGQPDGVLGFEAVGLSLPGATGLTLAELVAEGRLTNPPAAPIVIPGTPVESAALAWLHANCGNSCHNTSPDAWASSTGLVMRLSVGQMPSVEATSTYQTAVNVVSCFQPIAGESFDRIVPGNPALSAILYRASRRDTPQDNDVQMPPIGTNIVDTQGVALVEAWIQGM